MNPMYLGAQFPGDAGDATAPPSKPVLPVRSRTIAAAALALLVASWLLIVLLVPGHSMTGVPMAARHGGAPVMFVAPAPGHPIRNT